MKADGRIVLTLPDSLPEAQIQSIIHRHRRWISNRLRERQNQRTTGKPFSCREGALLPVLGGKVRLRLQTNSAKGGFWRFGSGILLVTAPSDAPSRVYPLVEDWYRKTARTFLEDRIPYWSRRIGGNFKKITVKNQLTLWASCSQKKNLNFNWRIVLLPFSTAEYLIIHELCHLRELSHSPRFWGLVEKHCPDYQKENFALKKVNHWLKFPPRY